MPMGGSSLPPGPAPSVIWTRPKGPRLPGPHGARVQLVLLDQPFDGLAVQPALPRRAGDVPLAPLEQLADVLALEVLQQLLLGVLEGEVLVERERGLLLRPQQPGRQVVDVDVFTLG